MAGPRTERPEPRRRRPRTPAGIPYATIEAVAARIHGIGGDGLVALRARLHSLRRLDFPNGVSGRSGRHFAYEFSDIIGVLAALELAEAYVPPAAAVAIVREGWPEIARCMLQGTAGGSGGDVATVHPNAVYHALEAGGERISDSLHVEIAALAPSSPALRTIDIRVGEMSRRAMEALDHLDRRAAGLARAQLPGLEAAFGRGTPLPRPDTADGRLRSDGPFWARALSLVAAAARDGVPEAGRRRAAWHLGYLVRPAPVEAWKTRVEVHPDLDDIGFGLAVAALAHRAGLRNANVRLSAAEADRAWSRLTAAIGDRTAVAAALARIAQAGERAGRSGSAAGGRAA